MAFLDNSGDIILDAVLTDTGRMRLAKGDGSFRIVKFALADDEIDYTTYNRNTGSAFSDLEILQTPVLEAFTNNSATMKSKLISINRNNLLFLPVIKVNNLTSNGNEFAISNLVSNGYILAVDQDTQKYLTQDGLTYDSVPVGKKGILLGKDYTGGAGIKLDQGIDNAQIPASSVLDPDLKETQYLLEIDNRLASIVDMNGTKLATPSYIDDDNIATYSFSFGVDTEFVDNIPPDPTNLSAGQVIAGARGTYLKFKLSSALEVSTSNSLFDKLGNSMTVGAGGFQNGSITATSVNSILTSVRISGVTTGNYIDIPLLVVRKT